MNENVSFNLIDEPWILVRDTEGEMREVSLMELFEQAPRIKCLANDLPTQDFAILRVLLAILQRSISPTLDDDDDPAEVWGRLWAAPELPVAAIREYLDKWHGRFDLFDAERPFMQVAGLRWKNGESVDDDKSNLKRIIADVPTRNEKRLFTQRVGLGIDRLTFAEATRWMVHLQAFDVGSPGAPVMGEAIENIKKGKVYPGVTGWDGMLGCLYLEGESLKDTLILNFLPTRYQYEGEIFSDDDLPAWESESLSVSDGHDEVLPIGRADLFTWQSRWVRLVTDGECVADAVVSAGKKLKKDYQYLIQFETMSSWKVAEPGSGGGGQNFKPIKHSAGKALWRGASSVFGGFNDRGDYCSPPAIIHWIGRMSERGPERVLDPGAVVRVHAVGFEYTGDSSCSGYTNSIDDYIELSSFLLSRQGEPLVNFVKECVASTTKAVGVLGYFAANLCRAAGGSGADEINHAVRTSSARVYHEIDLPFRLWISNLDKNSDVGIERRRWMQTARSIIEADAARLLENLGPDAIVGAPIRTAKGKNEWMTASRAEAIFNAALRKILPVGEDDQAKKGVC